MDCSIILLPAEKVQDSFLKTVVIKKQEKTEKLRPEGDLTTEGSVLAWAGFRSSVHSDVPKSLSSDKCTLVM